MKLKNKVRGYITGLTLAITLGLPNLMVHADVENVQSKLTSAGTQMQTLLSGLVVMAAIIVSLWIIITRMPSANDPQQKHEVYQSLGRVGGLVALGAAIIWILPWIYSLFT